VSMVVGFAREVDPRTITNACWAVFNVLMLSAIIRAATPQQARVGAAMLASEEFDQADADAHVLSA